MLLMPWLFVLPGHQDHCVLNMQDKWVLIFHKKEFQLPMPHLLCEMVFSFLNKLKWQPFCVSLNVLTGETRCFHTYRRSLPVLQAASLQWACWVLFSGGKLPTCMDSFTVALHSPRVVEGDCHRPLKNCRNFHMSHEYTIRCNWD